MWEIAPVPESIILCLKRKLALPVILKCLYPVLCFHFPSGTVQSRAICQCFTGIFINLEICSCRLSPNKLKRFFSNSKHPSDDTCRYLYSVVSVFVYYNQYLFKIFAKHFAIKIRRKRSTLFKQRLVLFPSRGKSLYEIFPLPMK